MAKDKDSLKGIVTQAPEPIESIGGRTYIPPRKPKKIDLQLWPKADHWSIEEAVHLLCGINPGFYKRPIRSPQDSLEQCIYRTYELLKKSYQAGGLKPISPGYLRFVPRDIIEWANKKELEVPPELGEIVNSDLTKLLPCKQGTKWEEIKISLIANDTVSVETPQGSGRLSYHELGLSDKRSGDKPKKMWHIFKLLATCNGRLDSNIDDSAKRVLLNDFNIDYYKKLPDYMKLLNKHLKVLFGIGDSIFKYHYYKHKAYVTKIDFKDRRDINISDLNDKVTSYENARPLHDIEVERIEDDMDMYDDGTRFHQKFDGNFTDLDEE